jgi:hypothetical protein
MTRIEAFEVQGDTPAWTVTHVSKFVVGALGRAEREGGPLPERFHLTLCPFGERNAAGGIPGPVHATLDPRFRLVHFTGCGRPYLVVLYIGADAAARQADAIAHLPWSEHYAVEAREGTAHLEFLAATEQPAADAPPWTGPRTLRELERSGELARF